MRIALCFLLSVCCVPVFASGVPCSPCTLDSANALWEVVLVEGDDCCFDVVLRNLAPCDLQFELDDQSLWSIPGFGSLDVTSSVGGPFCADEYGYVYARVNVGVQSSCSPFGDTTFIGSKWILDSCTMPRDSTLCNPCDSLEAESLWQVELVEGQDCCFEAYLTNLAQCDLEVSVVGAIGTTIIPSASSVNITSLVGGPICADSSGMVDAWFTIGVHSECDSLGYQYFEKSVHLQDSCFNSAPKSVIEVYPNPSNGSFAIDCRISEEKNGIVHYVVIEAHSGTIVHEAELVKGETIHRVEKLSKGTYVVVLLHEGQVFQTKRIEVK